MGTETNPWFWKSSDLELSCFSDEALITCIFMYLCSCKHYIPITKNESVVALMDLAGSPELSNKIWDRVEPCLDLWPTKWNCPLDPFGRKKIEKEFWGIKATTSIFSSLLSCWLLNDGFCVGVLHHTFTTVYLPGDKLSNQTCQLLQEPEHCQ